MKALLIIDIQNDYFPGGKAELVNPELALEQAAKILHQFREKRLPVIHVQHINVREGASFFLPDSDGAKIHERLSPQKGEHLVVKNYPNSFYKTDLVRLVNEHHISELVVCGMMTHMCIDTTVRAAKDHELPVTLISDACATKDLEFGGLKIYADQVQAAYLAGLSGMFAQIKTTMEFNID